MTRIKFAELLRKEFVLLDGAMGTMLQKKGLSLGKSPELLNLTKPDYVRSVHREYIEAGAQVIYANTFGANSLKMGVSLQEVAQAAERGIELAKEAAAGTEALVALDIGPLGELLEPLGTLAFEQAYRIFQEQVLAGVRAGADLIVCETMTDLGEMRAAVLAAKENSDLPVLATMTFEKNGRTFTGCGAPSMALTLTGMGVQALGLNCSLGPQDALPLLRELRRWTDLPLIVKPNAGMPNLDAEGYDVSVAEFAAALREAGEAGAQFLGGCCGTTPEYIAALRLELAKVRRKPRCGEIPAALCSSSRAITLDRVRVIGERINPTGKKRFQEALHNKDIDYILAQGIRQCEEGADVLDVNVGLPDIDEKETMVRVVQALQSVVDAPLQIDSAEPDVLEAALRVYHGKAIVNSVNGDQAVLDKLLPVIRKYGAAVVGLTLDTRGIPATSEGRLNVARRILQAAQGYGISERDVYIDCLTLTVSAEQESAMVTLEALRQIKKELGLKTVLGVSNISFGLPNREGINRSFLTLALGAGLDLPIINPGVPAMMEAVYSFRLLNNTDQEAREYVQRYSGAAAAEVKPAESPTAEWLLKETVIKGLKEEAAENTRQMLQKGTEALTVIDQYLIPALDQTGAAFERGEIFLPQLVQAAQAAQGAFEVVKASFGSGLPGISKGVVILATVKGDVHDIGKNIVKVLLENYGYTVIDLGRDVEPSAVVQAAVAHGAGLVGLSALMTTTLKSMEETVRALRASKHPCRIMVGGAVLTADYAGGIGADAYGPDAKSAVDIARRVFASERPE